MRRAGQVIASGDFTLLKYLEQLDGPTIERHVGFDRGRLKSGFLIVCLANHEIIGPDDFTLEASTRWSGGIVHSDPSGAKVGIESMLLNRGQDPAALKAKVAAFFLLDRAHTPAKVVPNLPHTEGMKYPDASILANEKRSGIPQFHLKHSCAKQFVIVRDDPGY